MLDIAVVGAGPAGLSAAVNAVARGKSVRVFSSTEPYLARAEQVNNYLGFPGVSGRDMMEKFRKHAEALGIKPEHGTVTNILPFGGNFMLNFSGEMVEAKAVILAVGAAKAKPISGEEELLGRGVSYCATCDGMLYREKKAVVCGDADHLAEEANFLREIGVRVTVVTPKTPAGLHEAIPVVTDTVVEIFGSPSVQGVKTKSGELETAAVFLLRNAIAPAALLPGLELKDGFVQVNAQMETNIPGCYACGDCVGKPLQVSKAVGEGLVAAQAAAEAK